MLHSGLIGRTIFNFHSDSLQAFPSGRRRIFRRAYLLCVRLFTISAREVRNSKLLFYVTSVLTAGVLTGPLVEIAYVSRRGIYILFPRLTGSTVRVGKFTAA